MAETDHSAALQSFRDDTRGWLEVNFPKSLKGVDGAVLNATGNDFSADLVDWTRKIGERGWGTPSWPKRYGGAGLSAGEADILRDEMARIGALNPIGRIGVWMLGPALMEYGTEEQKLAHLPPLARGEVRWCQGYSEPNAGSDLASLDTRAEDKGDYYLVNGQKTWTSNGRYAEWIFCLVRTDRSKKREGISFLLIDMRSPGVDIKPIKMISGESPFCEVFLTDVHAAKENMVGPAGGGWAISKYLLQHERRMISNSGGGSHTAGGDTRPLDVIAKEYLGIAPDGRLEEPDLRSRLTRHLMTSRAFALTKQRAAQQSNSASASSATSILKNVAANVAQDRAELLLEITGGQALGWAGDAFSACEIESTRTWLAGKSSSIAGGSSEIQNNIISKRILGLPDPVVS